MRTTVVLLALFALTAGSCAEPLGPEWDRLEQAERLWAQSGATHYAFTYRNACFCAPVAVRVELMDGVVVSVEPTDPEHSSFPPDVEPLTVEGLHQRIRLELERGPHEARIEFHPTLGYPTDVFFDYEEMVSDDEWGFSIQDFTILPEP